MIATQTITTNHAFLAGPCFLLYELGAHTRNAFLKDVYTGVVFNYI